jgi:hypothetical protein
MNNCQKYLLLSKLEKRKKKKKLYSKKNYAKGTAGIMSLDQI